jgi:hypothetical protein
MNSTKVVLILVLGLALVAAVVPGCSSIIGGVAACYHDDPKACTEFTGAVYTKAMVSESCEYEVLVGGCPTEDVVGKCFLNTNGLNELVIFYYTPADSLQSAQDTCATAGGDFETP